MKTRRTLSGLGVMVSGAESVYDYIACIVDGFYCFVEYFYKSVCYMRTVEIKYR